MKNKMNLKFLGLALVIFGIAVFSYVFFAKPKVSIVMPVYNGEKYLEKTVNFLLVSDFKDFEFIIIDDGSKDASYKILEELAQSDSRIKLYKNETNMGIIKTRNRGMALAKGKYIAPMDQDDWSMPERLRVEVNYLDENEDVDVVDVVTILLRDFYRGIKTVRYDAVSSFIKDENLKQYTVDERDENIKLGMLFSLGVPTQSGAMMRKDFLEKNDIKYKEGILYSDDYYLYADMVRKGAKFHHIEDIYHIYNDVREHENSFNEKQIEETYNVRKEFFLMAGLNADDYKENWDNVEVLICQVIDDLLQKDDNELIFSRSLLEKNKQFICNKKDI